MQDQEQIPTQPKPGIDTLSQSDINEIHSVHIAAAGKHYRQMLRMPRMALIKMALTEMNAKNTAYYFILSQGHYDAFSEYNKMP